LATKQRFPEKLFAQVIGFLYVQGPILKKGTIVDSIIIAMPFSTKKGEKKRDPDAHHKFTINFIIDQVEGTKNLVMNLGGD
jgi:hypothetical protein